MRPCDTDSGPEIGRGSIIYEREINSLDLAVQFLGGELRLKLASRQNLKL